MIKELTMAETVKLVKAALQKAYPGKATYVFYPDSKKKTIYIEFNGWIETKDVEKVTRNYEGVLLRSYSIGRGHCATIVRDTREELEHWLLPNGDFVECESRYKKPHPDAVLVKSGADIINVAKVPWV